MSEGANPCLFDSSDESSDDDSNVFNVQNDYAKKYNDWRRKEELQKLKDKYGDNLDIMSEIEDNEDEEDVDDEEGDEEDEEIDSDESDSNESIDEDPFDDDFLNIYSALKTKDPKIYDKSFKFFDSSKVDDQNENPKSSSKIKPTESKKLTLPEYHRKLIEEKKGITEEDENMLKDGDDEPGNGDNNPGYYEELYDIRKEINDIVGKTNIDDDADDNDLFSVKASKVSAKPNHPNKDIEKNKFISKIWSKSKELDKNEEFLKDFVVNRRYCDSGEFKEEIKKYTNVDGHFGGFNNSSNTNDSEGFAEEASEPSTSFAKSNIEISKYHFEEPDANLIKRYPRAINSIRDTVKEKKTKRAEIRERKKTEKETELKRLRKLKREETESKLQKLKEISGNQSISMKDLDLNVIIDDENDFEPEKYDEKMKLLFGESYYCTDDDQSKPQFDYIPEIDGDLGVDNDLDDSQIVSNNNNKKQKKNKKEIKQKKDIMADDDIGIYEDLIGGEVPTRFLYRMVEPNDFGLTDEEIMLADDKELNQWCSLKKMSQYRSKDAELYDKKVYSQKAANMELKKKILKSIYGNVDKNNDDNDEEEANININGNEADKQITPKSKKRGKTRRAKKNKTKSTSDNSASGEAVSVVDSLQNVKSPVPALSNNISKSKKRKRKQKLNKLNGKQQPSQSDVDLQRLKAYGISNKEIKKLKTKL